MKRVRNLAQESQTVESLKTALKALGFEGKFTYMRKDDLIAALLELKEEEFKRSDGVEDITNLAPKVTVDYRSGADNDDSSASKKRKHRERDDAEQMDREQ